MNQHLFPPEKVHVLAFQTFILRSPLSNKKDELAFVPCFPAYVCILSILNYKQDYTVITGNANIYIYIYTYMYILEIFMGDNVSSIEI